MKTLDPQIVARARELKAHGLNTHEVVFLMNRDHPRSRGRWTARRVQQLLKGDLVDAAKSEQSNELTPRREPQREL